MAGIGSHTRPTRGATDDWLTPTYIVWALGPFDVDPCCPPEMPWFTARVMYSDGGLTREWNGRVWLNPPYGQETPRWLERLKEHGNGIALVFARTETKMFFDHVWNDADALLFIKNRLHFHHVDGTRARGNAGGPSVLVAYGRGNAERLEASGIEGAFVKLKGATIA